MRYIGILGYFVQCPSLKRTWLDIANHGLQDFCDKRLSFMVPEKRQIHLVYRVGDDTQNWKDLYSDKFSLHNFPGLF